MTDLVLPPEIVALVIDHIDDRDTLVTCSLVSLQWVSGSRFHMFRSVAVENMHAIHTLVELLESPLSTIRSAVRHLSVEVNYAFADSLGADQAAYTAPLLLRLSNACTLKSLQFLHHHASFFSSTRSMETALFFPPWSCFRTLQTLSIGVWTSPDVIDFIASSFPDLRELEIDGTSSLPDLGQTRAMPPRALRVVRLTRCDFDTVLNWLLPEHLQPSCSSLTLGSISDVQGTTVSRALHRCGPVLEDLSLTLRVSGNQDFLPPDLSRNINLRSLRVEPDIYLEALPRILCTLTSPSLTQLELVMPGRPARLHSHDETRWAELDRHLLLPQFSRLSIKVQLHKAIDEDIIQKYLPLCTARGIISFISKPILYMGRIFRV